MPLAGEKTRPVALPTACDGMAPVGHLSRPARPWDWYGVPYLRLRKRSAPCHRIWGPALHEDARLHSSNAARSWWNDSSVGRNATAAARHIKPERLTGRNHRIIPCLCRVTLLRVDLVHGTQHTAPQVGRVSGHGVGSASPRGHRGTDPTGLRWYGAGAACRF